MIQQDIFTQNIEEHIPIRKTLTYEELEIAVNYLKKRFPNHSIQQIVDSMNKHHQLRKQRLGLPLNYYPPNQNNFRTNHEIDAPHTNLAIQPITPKESREQKRIREKEDLKMISTLFCERGNDFKYAQTFMADLTPTTYKNKLVSIMGSVVKELLGFIRKQCKTKPPELTENQVFTIKSALISAHEWMALKSASALSTFFNFITRININRHKLITKEQAIQLYNVIAARVNDKSLDLIFLQPEDEFGNQIQERVRPSHREVRSFNSQNQVREIIAKAFLQYCNFQKVSSFLLNKYGLDSRFGQENLNISLRDIVESSINKINTSVARSAIVCSPPLLQQIFQEQNRNILYALVQVFLRKTDDKHFYRKVMSQVRKLQNKQSTVPQHPRDISLDQQMNQQNPQMFFDESLQRQDFIVEQQPKEMRMNREHRYDTDCIFEEMFQVLLPKQNNSNSEGRVTTSSKRQALAESVLYFDQ